MNTGKTIFAQLMDFIPSAYEFRCCVERYHGHYKVKSFSCWDQFLTLAFAQLTYRESLRDIEACLRAAPQKLYHMGLRGLVSRNTLANANQVRDWRIYADFAHILIQEARRLYKGEPFGMVLDQTVYALDATIIDLCLSLFPWAQFRRHKSAVKLHTLLDLRGSIPTVVIVTGGQIHEVNILDQLIWEAGAIYLDGPRLRRFPKTLSAASVGSVLCDSSQKAIRLSALVLSKGGQKDRLAMRSDCRTQQSYPQVWLSRAASPSALLRPGHSKTAGLSHQQLSLASSYHYSALSVPLASGTVLSMDQTASEDQSFLWHFGKRSANSGLDCYRRLRVGCHRQKTAQSAPQPPCHSPDFERVAFGKTPYSTSAFAIPIR